MFSPKIRSGKKNSEAIGEDERPFFVSLKALNDE